MVDSLENHGVKGSSELLKNYKELKRDGKVPIRHVLGY